MPVGLAYHPFGVAQNHTGLSFPFFHQALSVTASETLSRFRTLMALTWMPIGSSFYLPRQCTSPKLSGTIAQRMRNSVRQMVNVLEGEEGRDPTVAIASTIHLSRNLQILTGGQPARPTVCHIQARRQPRSYTSQLSVGEGSRARDHRERK